MSKKKVSRKERMLRKQTRARQKKGKKLTDEMKKYARFKKKI